MKDRLSITLWEENIQNELDFSIAHEKVLQILSILREENLPYFDKDVLQISITLTPTLKDMLHYLKLKDNSEKMVNEIFGIDTDPNIFE